MQTAWWEESLWEEVKKKTKQILTHDNISTWFLNFLYDEKRYSVTFPLCMEFQLQIHPWHIMFILCYGAVYTIWHVLYLSWLRVSPSCVLPVRPWSTCSSSSSSLVSCTREPPVGWRRSSSGRASRNSSSPFALSWAWTAAARRTWCSRRSDTVAHTSCQRRTSLSAALAPCVTSLSFFADDFIFFIYSSSKSEFMFHWFWFVCRLVLVIFFHFSFCAFCEWRFNPSSFLPPTPPHCCHILGLLLDSLGVWPAACLSVVTLWGSRPSQ